ncbi:MAG: PQQ-binding-like beta-propeller repeat protein [Acidobacteriota bacterium]
MIRTGTIFVFYIFWFLLWSTGAVSSDGSPPVYFRKNGGVFASIGAFLPERLESTEMLRWRTPLDSGHSSPIVCNGKIFLTTFNRSSEELATLALDAETGEVQWKRTAPTNEIEAYNYPTGNAAQATPACDGERLYVFFGSCGLLCYDLEG